MQSVEESKILKTGRAKSISQSRFSKRFSSCVGAFSLKETYDDLITAQQMICNKKSPQERSPQESTNSIAPTNSLKMFESEQADKLNQSLYEPETDENKNTLNDITDSIGSMTATNSLKYLSSDDVSDASLITIGEHENMVIDLSEAVIENTNVKNFESEECDDDMNQTAAKVEDVTKAFDEDIETCKIEDKIPTNYDYYTKELAYRTSKTEIFVETANQNEDTNDKSKIVFQHTSLEPEAIFEVAKHNRKCKKKRASKRMPKKIINIKQNNFKYKNPKKAIDDRLEKYYEKRNYIDSCQIQKELYSDEVSTVVSRTRVLHKIIAKENPLVESEFISFIGDVGLNEYGNESVSSSMSTEKKSIVSNSSQGTLTQKASTTSTKNNAENAETTNSVIKIPTENVPYKTDIINVAVAVAYNRTKANSNDETLLVPSQEKFMHLGSLTSCEIETPFITNLTSDLPAKLDDFKEVTIETSDDTMVNKSSLGVSSDDFVIARTSSDFTKSSDDSTETLKNRTETLVDIETEAENNVEENKPTLFETVINLGIYPEISASTSSDAPYEFDNNNVIVTKDLSKKYVINPDMGDNKDQKKHILKKAINQQNDKLANKTINLPNQAEINAMLEDHEIPQMKCAEESRHPSYMPAMWDRLVMTLEIAVKRLEDNLVEKIVKELKITLSHPFPINTPISETSKASISGTATKVDAEQGLQCDLVKNTVIDQIMQKLSSDGPKVISPRDAIKTLQRSKLFKDFEVLKPPALSHLIAERDNTVTVSTVTYEVCNFRRLKTLLAGPLNFIRENVFVISGVPTFFVVLLCVYGLILLLMKP